MLLLNLIPRQLKHEIKFKRFFILLKKINYIVIIFTIIMAIIILTAKIILQNNFNKVVEQTTLITKNSQSYNIKVKKINSKLDNVSQIQDSFVIWSNLIENLANITPPGIHFASTKINIEKQTINITGIAIARNDLLEFKQNMENLPNFYDVQYPLKDILQKENINFEINAHLNLNLHENK